MKDWSYYKTPAHITLVDNKLCKVDECGRYCVIWEF